MPVRAKDKKQLTTASVAGARYPSSKSRGPHYVWDTVLQDFVLAIYPSGTKTFYLVYDSPLTGKQRYLRLGDAALV
ncbi:MAG TPA: hypothetical protein VGG03_05915, partial [Thermoanaerobaculia bacterium]